MELEPVEGRPDGLHELPRHAPNVVIVVEREFLATFLLVTSKMKLPNEPRHERKAIRKGQGGVEGEERRLVGERRLDPFEEVDGVLAGNVIGKNEVNDATAQTGLNDSSDWWVDIRVPGTGRQMGAGMSELTRTVRLS